ncbi:MAG: class I SAM-dependent methyltransferase [Betaproteobacteria bacterium]|nr:class I SAM-dependent methyltransferase [Betaproteobacteria bacterium]
MQRESVHVSGSSPDQFFGADFLGLIQEKTVIDFGCGGGLETIEMVRKGAARVIGLDIQLDLLESAARKALAAGLAERCDFVASTSELADIIVSKDAFEHFADPAQILAQMERLLKPGGYVLAAFGPTWLHPYGGHLFSVFPWSHLIFSEQAQIRWRSQIRNDGATRFSEVAGGLNQLTIGRFEKIVAASPLQIEWLDTIPIRGLPLLKSRPLREFGSSIVRCKLSRRPAATAR